MGRARRLFSVHGADLQLNRGPDGGRTGVRRGRWGMGGGQASLEGLDKSADKDSGNGLGEGSDKRPGPEEGPQDGWKDKDSWNLRWTG